MMNDNDDMEISSGFVQILIDINIGYPLIGGKKKKKKHTLC
jgi:hypothetical protein